MEWEIVYYSEDLQKAIMEFPAGIQARYIHLTERMLVFGPDLGMPHIDGRKVASSIKMMSSATPVILLTGWGQRLIASNDIPPHVDKLLSKTPRLHELRAAFAELVR